MWLLIYKITDMLFKAWKDIFLAVESESKDERYRTFGHLQADKTETMITKLQSGKTTEDSAGKKVGM